MATTEPIRNKSQVWGIAEYFLRQGQLRNYALVLMGVHTALRISDLLRLKWGDVYDFDADAFRAHIHLTEGKTKKKKTVALNKEATAALNTYLSILADKREDAFLFSSRRGNGPIGRVQAYRIIREAAEAVGIPERVSCHSLRKTFGYHAWKSGVHAAVIMDIYNHSSLAVTRRYLGVSQDDLDQVYMGMKFGR